MGSLYDVCHANGGMTADAWDRDPRRLGFILARYKAAAKLLAGKENVLEVGCADGFASRVMRQEVGRLMAVDIDPLSIEEANRNTSPAWPIRYHVHDIMQAPMPGFDAVYAMDLFEHIADEDTLLANLRACAPIAVIGTPSLESQDYASELSRAGHVNCKGGADFREALQRHWRHVFVLGMNDEVAHLGFLPMCQYLIGIGVA